MSQSQESGQETRQGFHRLGGGAKWEEKQYHEGLDIKSLPKRLHFDLPPQANLHWRAQ